MQCIVESDLKCFHCGDNCLDMTVSLQENYFCCEGCKSVYEILNNNELCGYYNISSFPGKKGGKNPTDKYAYLENEKIFKRLIEFREERIAKITFYLPDIHCNSCIWLLENLPRLNSGILNSKINYLKKELSVSFDEKSISLRELADLLDSINYPPLINLEQLDKAEKEKTISNKNIYYKIGIAGFCFGNIMLLSFPDYLADELTQSFSKFFSYLSFLLSLPVFFYCASDYFISSYNALRAKVINIDFPIALGLVVVYGRSIVEIFSHTGTGYLDSFSGLVFFLLVGKWYQKKTYDAISFERDYKSYFPVAVNKIVLGEPIQTAINELKEGDRILIRNQELIPADAVIIKGNGNIDYSFVTGESLPIQKNEGDEVFAGGRQVGESIELILSKKVNQSYFTQLWNQGEFNKRKQSPLWSFTNMIGKYFTVAVIIISAGSYFYWTLNDPSKALFSAIAVLIVFCPCILALAIPFGFGNAMSILGKHGFYLKNIEGVETLANINTIVFDKTGTLTNTSSTGVKFIGKNLTQEELKLIKSITKNSTHPLSKSIFHSIVSNTYPIQKYQEISFKGISGLIQEQEIKLGSYRFLTGQEAQDSDPFSKVYLSIGGKLLGYFSIGNKFRSGIQELITCLTRKFDLHVLSGDNPFQKSYLSSLFKSSANLHFNQSPVDKFQYVSNLKNKDKSVLMVGDGLNDAGALKESDFGISVSDDVYNFSPACDAIIDSERVKDLMLFLRFCKNCSHVVKLSLCISLSYNFIGLYFAISGTLSPMIAALIMPASSISVVLFVIAASNLFARRLPGIS